MCKTWQDSKIHPRPRTEDARFETSRGVIIDPVAEAGFGDARRRGGGTTGGCRIRGNLEKHRRRSWRREFGETWKLTAGNAGRQKASGRPGAESPGAPEGARAQEPGKLGSSGDRSPVQQKEQELEIRGSLETGRFEELRPRPDA